LAALNGAFRLIRIAIVSNYTDRSFADNSDINYFAINTVTLEWLPLFTFTSLYGLLCLLTTFMYTMRWSRPTFYLNGVFLGVAFVNDMMCLGWAAKMIDLGAPDGLESQALALGALSILSAIIAFVQAFVHIWSSPPHPEPAWFGACSTNDMKLTGDARNVHLGLGLPNLALRVVRVAIAADLWNKFLNQETSQTESSLNSIAWTLWEQWDLHML